jgi:RimJ/RimL family protein N-acetyltransferase
MGIQLRPFTDGDLEAHQHWQSRIALGKFMSRSAPHAFNGVVDQSSSEYRWFVIAAGGCDIGTIWLEREADDTNAVRLGIFLGDGAYFDKHIGRQAIDQVITICRSWFDFKRVRLNVRLNNARAIACYTACGFRPIGQTKRNTRDNVLDVLTMEKEA